MADGLKKYRSNPIEPDHYNKGIYEAINVIEAWGLGFCLGNAVKYICRAGKKEGNTTKQDLQKAVWYLEREIARIDKVSKCSLEVEYCTDKPAVMCDPNFPELVENASFDDKKYIPKSHENSLV